MSNAVEKYQKAQHLQLTDKLLVEMRGHTALLTLNNPSANTWDAEMLQGVKQLVEHLNDDKDIYALVVTGAGSKFFSAGADLKLFASGDKAVARSMARYFGEAFEALSNYRGVTIAAINGYAMGGGLECALACDIRIAEEQAQMALPEATVGLLPCAGGTQKLPWLTPVLSLVGGLFLLAYGLFALQRAWRGGSHISLSTHGNKPATPWLKTLLFTLAITLLNPHVYLDTVLLVGSVAAPFAADAKLPFWLGAATMSGLWFFGLGFGARLLLPLFRRARTWQLLDAAIALMMFYLAWGLLRPLILTWFG